MRSEGGEHFQHWVFRKVFLDKEFRRPPGICICTELRARGVGKICLEEGTSSDLAVTEGLSS